MTADEVAFAAMVESDLDEEPRTMEALDELLGEVISDSDANLRAAAWFFGLDLDRLEEKAATLEHEGNIPRVTANRKALTEVLQGYKPDIEQSLCRWFSRNSIVVYELALKHDMSREQAREEVLSFARRHNGNHSAIVHDMDMLLERIA